MDHDLEEIRQNVAFMRQVITEARTSALGDGSGFIAAGLLFGLAGIVTPLVDALHITLPGGPGAPFSMAIVLFVAQALLRRGRGGAAVPRSAAARIAAHARIGVILAMVTLLAGFYLYVPGRTLLMPLAPVVVFSIYGAAWLAVAGLTSAVWPRWVAGLSYATALALAVLAGTQAQLPGFGVAMLALVFVPGLMVRRTAKRRWPD